MDDRNCRRVASNH